MNIRNLILSMNNITKITNLENFTNLDMIDLHDNNISGAIDFQTCFSMLKNLKDFLKLWLLESLSQDNKIGSSLIPVGDLIQWILNLVVSW